MSRRPPKQQPMTTLLLRAIKSCGRNPNRLAKEAGISGSLIYKFMKGKGSLRMTSADRFANALNLKVTARVKAPAQVRS